jgi:thioesterase domain-containing protein
MVRNVLRFTLVTIVIMGLVPSAVSAKVIPDKSVTPTRTAIDTRPIFSGLLPAPAGEAFFVPPSPLPGNPGDVIWAMKSATPSLDINGPAGAAFPLRQITGTSRRPDVWRILFHSMNRAGESVPGAALVVLDPARHIGSPIVVGMHGWVGLGDRCGIFGGPFGANGAGANSFVTEFLDAGSVVVLPDGPGAAVPGLATPMITADATRHLIDSVYAAQQLTGSSLSVVFQGHSLGGSMVYGVAAEATAYGSNLAILGTIAHQPGGVFSPNSPFVDFSVGKASRSTTAIANAVAYAMQLEAAYSKKVAGVEKSLTPKGVKIARRSEQHCNAALQQETIVARWESVFKGQVLTGLDPGPLRPTFSPLLMVVTQSDETVDPLAQWHAYDRYCSSGRPVTWIEVPGDHIVSIRPNDPSLGAVRAGIRRFLANPTEAACSPVTPLMSSRFTYTVSSVAKALGIPFGKKGRVLIKASGACTTRGEVVQVRQAGVCNLQVTVRSGGKTTNRSVVARVLS